jgi:hypothetical protein
MIIVVWLHGIFIAGLFWFTDETAAQHTKPTIM